VLRCILCILERKFQRAHPLRVCSNLPPGARAHMLEAPTLYMSVPSSTIQLYSCQRQILPLGLYMVRSRCRPAHMAWQTHRDRQTPPARASPVDRAAAARGRRCGVAPLAQQQDLRRGSGAAREDTACHSSNAHHNITTRSSSCVYHLLLPPSVANTGFSVSCAAPLPSASPSDPASLRRLACKKRNQL
jgi:hypothetical protein